MPGMPSRSKQTTDADSPGTRPSTRIRRASGLLELMYATQSPIRSQSPGCALGGDPVILDVRLGWPLLGIRPSEFSSRVVAVARDFFKVDPSGGCRHCSKTGKRHGPQETGTPSYIPGKKDPALF